MAMSIQQGDIKREEKRFNFPTFELVDLGFAYQNSGDINVQNFNDLYDYRLNQVKNQGLINLRDEYVDRISSQNGGYDFVLSLIDGEHRDTPFYDHQRRMVKEMHFNGTGLEVFERMSNRKPDKNAIKKYVIRLVEDDLTGERSVQAEQQVFEGVDMKTGKDIISESEFDQEAIYHIIQVVGGLLGAELISLERPIKRRKTSHSSRLAADFFSGSVA